MTEITTTIPRELTREELLDILRRMWEIRIFEDTVYDLLGQNVISESSCFLTAAIISGLLNPAL